MRIKKSVAKKIIDLRIRKSIKSRGTGKTIMVIPMTTQMKDIDMRIAEVDLIGRPSPRFDEICRKHNVSYSELMTELSKGIKVELEHTGDMAQAREIALDHLDEFPDYYTRLGRVER